VREEKGEGWGQQEGGREADWEVWAANDSKFLLLWGYIG